MNLSETVRYLKSEIKILHQIVEIINKADDLGGLLQNIANVLSVNFKGDSCLIYLYDQDTFTLVLEGAWPPHPHQLKKIRLSASEGITGWVAKHKKPTSLSKNAYNDPRFKIFQNLPEDKYKSLLSVPVIINSITIGVINISNRRAKVFTSSQIKQLVNIANQVAGAIEKMKLLKNTNIRLKQIETLAQLSNTIVSNNYLHEILQLIVTMTAQMMNSKICSLMLLDEQKKELKIAATQSLSEDYRKKPPTKIGQSISGQALLQKKAVFVVDVKKEPSYGYPEVAEKEGLCSMLSVPMLIKNKPIGVINCYTTEEHEFTGEEKNVLQTIANQSAVAIENTRLIEESQTSRDALQTRKVIERAKGVLMKEKQIGEEEAFQFIQRQAMNLRRSMREISEAILLNNGLRIKP